MDFQMITLNEKFLAPFVRDNEIGQMECAVAAAKKTVDEKSGAGAIFSAGAIFRSPMTGKSSRA